MTPLAAQDRVIELLKTFNEARVTYGRGSTGNGVILMPSMWHEGSYAELEQRLKQMREGKQRPLWWHLSHRYRWGVERTILCPVVRRRLGPEFVLPRFTELVAGGPAVGSKHAIARVYSWSEKVDDATVGKGVRVLTDLMFDGDWTRIELPKVVLQRLLGLPMEPETVAV